MAYCGVDELKEYLGVTGATDDPMLLTLLAAAQRTIEWSFTRQDADQKLGRHYVPKLAC